ncbi:hypothetical protein MHL86_01215 [Brevibacillus laterosporus]|nr:hypothetical protein [Brevibacillus laterosporus]
MDLMIDTDEEAIADVDGLCDFLSKWNVIFTQYESKTKEGDSVDTIKNISVYDCL